MERIGEWLPFSKTLYLRKLRQYTLGGTDWERMVPNVSSTVLAVAPCGGPIAAACNTAAGTSVAVFSASGKCIKELSCPSDAGAVVALGWTKEESLMALTSRNTLALYELSAPPSTTSVLAGPVSTFKLGTGTASAALDAPLAYVLRPCGFAAVLGAAAAAGAPLQMHAIIVEERKEPERLSATIPAQVVRGCSVTCLDVLPHDLTEEDETLVYVGTSADASSKCGTVVVVNVSTDTVTDVRAKFIGGVASIAVSLNCGNVAVLSQTGAVFVCQLNFDAPHMVLNLGVAVPPKSFAWCGSRMVCLTYCEGACRDYASTDEEQNSSVHFSIFVPVEADCSVHYEKIAWDQDGSGWCTVIPEVDGVRVLTDSHYLFVEEVPASLCELCQLKPTSAAARFAVAHRDMSSGNVRGLTTIREMVQQLRDKFELQVIELLLDGALCEFSIHQQEKILSAATDAKSRWPTFDSDKYVDVTKRLRVVNRLRDADCGIPISIRQYQHLSGTEHLRTLSPSEMQVLVDRLINRREFQLALDIAVSLKLRTTKILVQWSCSLVQRASLSDSQIASTIASVFSLHRSASYVEAARSAIAAGRHTLAVALLQYEPRAQQQVLLLLQMGQEDLALQKAFDSDEVDLLVMVLIKLLTQRTEQQIFNLLSGYPHVQRWVLYGSRNVSLWRDVLIRYWIDTKAEHLVGFEKLRRILLNDRDKDFAKFRETCDSARSAAERSVDDDDDGDDDETNNTTAGAAEYDELEHLRQSSDNDERDGGDGESATGGGEKIRSLGKAVRGIFSLKAIAKLQKKDKVAAKVPSAAPTHTSASDGPLSVVVPVPGKQNICGTTLITTDDMIDLCRYFAPHGAGEVEGRWCRNHMTLLEEQRKLANDTGEDAFLNQSVVQTIEMCFYHDKDAAADMLRSKFGVSEKKFVYAKLRSLCKAKRWADVDKMFGAAPGARPRSFKSCIGFQPIVEILARHDRQQQATQFVPRLDDVCVRVDWYVKLDCFQLAIDDAFAEESADLIQQILKKAHNPSVLEYGQRKLKELS